MKYTYIFVQVDVAETSTNDARLRNVIKWWHGWCRWCTLAQVCFSVLVYSKHEEILSLRLSRRKCEHFEIGYFFWTLCILSSKSSVQQNKSMWARWTKFYTQLSMIFEMGRKLDDNEKDEIDFLNAKILIIKKGHSILHYWTRANSFYSVNLNCHFFHIRTIFK